MSEKPKVSVIIPVYNAQDYLRECIESVINQTLKEIEIICINDGSTDGSGEILEEFAKKDSRIKIITQENKGVSAARNLGIKEARGEYLAFVDADDYIELQTYEKAYNKALSSSADVVIFNVHCIYNGKKIKNNFHDVSRYFNKSKIPDIFTYKEIKEHILSRDWDVWNKIYKTDFVKKNHIMFLKNTVFSGTSPFHAETLIKAKSIAIIEERLYNYRREVENSIMWKTKDLKKFESLIYAFDKIKIILVENEIFDEFKHNYANYVINEFRNYYGKINNVQVAQEFLKEIRKYAINFKGINAYLEPQNLELAENLIEAGKCSEDNIYIKFEKLQKECAQRSYENTIEYLRKRVKYHQNYKKLFFVLWVLAMIVLAGILWS